MKRFMLLMVFGWLIAAAVFSSGVAKADVGGNSPEVYAAKFGDWVVCDTFNTRGVAPSTMDTVGMFLLNIGFTSKEAATVVVDSLLIHCPDLYNPVTNMVAAGRSNTKGVRT